MKKYKRGQIISIIGGGKFRIINPEWPNGTEPYWERIN